MYFGDIQPYWHGFNKPGIHLDLHYTSEEPVITEKDFSFFRITLDEYYSNTTHRVFLLLETLTKKIAYRY